MNEVDIFQIVDRLIGNIIPTIDVHENGKLKKQKCAEFLIDVYLGKMEQIAIHANHKPFDRRGKRAYNYLRDLQKWINEELQYIDNMPDIGM